MNHIVCAAALLFAVAGEPESDKINWQNVAIEPVSVLSTYDNEYLPALSWDNSTLFYVSTQTAYVPDSSSKIVADESHNLWYRTRRQDNSFGAAEYLTVLNSPYNEGGVCIGADGRQFLFVSCGRPGVYGDCDILVLRPRKDSTGKERWMLENPGPNVNTEFWESMPAVAPDGTLYFVSNRPGGTSGVKKQIDMWSHQDARGRQEQYMTGGGNIDIWYCPYDWETGEWKPAINAGRTVNTSGNEMAPFVNADGTMLFFSSNGHKHSVGGLDFYVSAIAADGSLGEPQNLGEPLNSPKDDLGFFITRDNTEIYFSSKRRDGKHTKIYRTAFPAPVVSSEAAEK
jgi:Tol biopolymer transport system component